MKIEKGKFYKTRDGRKVGPMAGGTVFFWVEGKSVDPAPEWRPDGTPTQDGVEAFGMTDNDTLIAEWTDEPRPWGELTDAEKGALLLAENEGKCVQFLNELGNWQNLSSIKFTDYMERIWFNNQYAYRVKPPEPVVETVTLTGFPDDEGGTWCFGKDSLPEDTHRITFTTKDGEPDCDSIKMERIDDT